MPADTETETADPADDLELDTTAYGIQERLDAEVDPPGARKELLWAMGEYERRVRAEGRELFSYYLEDKRKRKQEVDSLFDNPEVPGLMDDYTGPNAKEQRQRTANMAEFALRGGYETEDAVTMYPLFKDIYARAAGKESMSDGELWEHISASKAVERAFHGSAIRSAVNHQPVSKSLSIWEQIARGSLGWSAERLQESLELHEQTRKHVGAKVEKLDPDARNIIGILQGANHDGDLAKALPYMRGKSEEDLAILWMILEREAKHQDQEKGFGEQSSQAVERSFRDVLMKMGRTIGKLDMDGAVGLLREGDMVPANLKTAEEIVHWKLGENSQTRELMLDGNGSMALAYNLLPRGEMRALSKEDYEAIRAYGRQSIEDKRTIAKLQNFSDLTLDPIKGSNWFTKYVYYPALSSSGVLATSMMGPTGFMINSMGLADDRYNELRDLGVAHEAAMRDSLIVGGLKAGVNQAQVGVLVGKVPVFNRAMASLVGKPGGSAAWRFGAHYGGTMLTETGLELVEDHLVPAAVQQVTGEGGPVDWFSDRGPLMNAIRATPETAGPMVLLSFLGAGHATASDIHVSRQLMQSREALLQVGYGEAQVAQIREAAGCSAREGQEVMRALWDKRPNDQRSMQEAAKALQAQVRRQQAAVRELDQQGELPMMRSTAQGAWQVSFANGTTVELPTVEAANAARWQWLREKHPESYRRMEGMFGGGDVDSTTSGHLEAAPTTGLPVSEETELSFSIGTRPAMVRTIDNPTPNATLQGDEARNPKAIFRALTGEGGGTNETHSRGGPSTSSGQRRKHGRTLVSFADFVAWANAHGRNTASEEFSINTFEATGGEHLVFFDEASGRAVKVTKPGLVGAQAEDVGAYIQRWMLTNEVFGDDVRIEGIVTLPGEDAPRVVISQPWRKGKDSSKRRVRDYLRSKGFHEHEGLWIHPVRRVKVWDAFTRGNVITTKSGPMAVDLQVEPASNEDVRAVQEKTGFGGESSFSLPAAEDESAEDVDVVQEGVSAEDVAELQRRLNATPLGRALLEGALFLPDRSGLDGKEGRPGQSHYSEKAWRKMEYAEGFHDPRKNGRPAVVFLNNVEVRQGETPLDALGRVLSHERVGHKEFNKLLAMAPELAKRWKLLAGHIPTGQLDALRTRYDDLEGVLEGLAFEWFADRAGVLDSRDHLQPGSLLDQMWQVVSDFFRELFEPLRTNPSKQMTQEALDANVRVFLRKMRKNMLEEAKGGSAGINGNAALGTLLSRGSDLSDGPDASVVKGPEEVDTAELDFAMPGGSRPPLVIGTALNPKQPVLEREEGNLGDSRVRERIAEAIIGEKGKAVAITDETQRNEALERLVKKHYKKEAYADFMNMSGKDIVYLTMPSSSGINRIPEYLAKQLAKDFGGKIEEGGDMLGRILPTESKRNNTFIAKSRLSSFRVTSQGRLDAVKGKNVVLVDDIITSGDSTDAVLTLLRENGIAARRVVALAARNDGASPSAETVNALAKTLHMALRGMTPAHLPNSKLSETMLKYAQTESSLKQVVNAAIGDSREVLLQKANVDASSSRESAATVFRILLERAVRLSGKK